MENMQRRSADIGARIDWSDREGGGTTVTVTFALDLSRRR